MSRATDRAAPDADRRDPRGSLLDRLTRDGADVDVPPEPSDPDLPDEDGQVGARGAAALVALLRRAADALPDEAASLAAWDEAGEIQTPAAIDAARAELTGFRLLGFLRATSRRRLGDAARIALRRTSRAGSLRLAAAFVGELGDEDDLPALETIARHPALTLHGATALANLRSWHGRLALLRLLTTTGGEQRVLVIDRLLPHAGQAAVRLALVRDALPGLSPEHAREVARDIAEVCRCRELAGDASIAAEVRDGARTVLAAAEAPGESAPAAAGS